MGLLRERHRRAANFMNPLAQEIKLGNLLGMIPSAGLTGNVYYADPSSGNDKNAGTSPDKAKKTLQAAIDLCTNNNGDFIIRMRGGEAVTSTVLFNKSGITVVAQDYGMAPLANGEYFATYSETLVDAPVGIVSADGVTIAGLGFAGDDATATFYGGAALLIGGVGLATPFGVRIVSCRFPKWGLDNRIGIAVEGSSDCIIEHCCFEGVGADFDSGVYIQGATQNIQVSDNRFQDCTYGVLLGTITGGTGGPHLILKSNVFEDSKVLSAGVGAGVNTGLVCDNWCEGATDTGSYSATVDNLNTGGFVFSGNHYAE